MYCHGRACGRSSTSLPPAGPAAGGGAGEAGEGGDAQFLVKWVGRSHLHDEWVPGSLLLRLAKRKLVNFKRRYGSSPCLFMQVRPPLLLPCCPVAACRTSWTGKLV